MKGTTKTINMYDSVRLMLDAAPFCCHLWNRDGEIIDCNKANIEFFKLLDKRELLDNFFFFSPECQPDGQRSDEKARVYLKKTFEEGKCVLEWMYQASDGTPLPTEITLVRVRYGEDDIVAAYSRDLREHKRMMREIMRRDSLLASVNRAAAVLLRPENDACASDSRRCMGMTAYSGMVNPDSFDIVFLHKLYC